MTKVYKTDFQLLPKDLDAKVAKLHFPALGAELTANSSLFEPPNRERAKAQALYSELSVHGADRTSDHRHCHCH